MNFIPRCVVVIVISVLATRSAAAAQTRYHTFDDVLTQFTAVRLPAERDSILEDFWRQAHREGIPWVDSTGRNVTFFYRGRADSVKVTGDFTSWMFSMNMRRLPQTDLHYLRLTFEEDARFDYKMIVNGKPVLDPLNRARVRHKNGENSELAMPRFVRTRDLHEPSTGPKGTLLSQVLPAAFEGNEQRVQIYLPNGYDAGKADYPTVYVLNGADYLAFANAAAALDNMIASKTIPPVIAVFVIPTTDTLYHRLSEPYAEFFTEEIIPLVDKKFRTKQAGTQRLLLGNAHGGLSALHIGFLHPTTITNIASQSGFLSFNGDTLLTIFGRSLTKPLRLYFDVGTYEKNIGRYPEDSFEGNLYRANRNFRRLLDQKGYDFVYREFHDGHSWGRWRNEFPFILRWFLARLTQ